MKHAISIRELAFVRDVLIPRAWVQGAEVDELVNLRARIDAIFGGLSPEAPPNAESPEPPKRTKKPRHPKKGGKPAQSASAPC